MFSRSRPLIGAAVLACATFWICAVSASAFVYSDLRWSLNESTTSYGGGTQFHISLGGGGTVSYKWLDGDMTKTTVISGNACGDLSLYGKSTFNGGDTSYHALFAGLSGQCFLVRGRTTSGSTIAHNARLRR